MRLCPANKGQTYKMQKFPILPNSYHLLSHRPTVLFSWLPLLDKLVTCQSLYLFLNILFFSHPRESMSSPDGTKMQEKDGRRSSEVSMGTWFRFVITPSFLSPEIEGYAYPGHGTTSSPYIVSWLENDIRNPLNFPAWRRWLITVLAAISCFAISFTSSAYTGGIAGIKHDFGVQDSIAQLGVSLFVLGFAVGPLFWGPLSETYGRQPVFMGTFGALVVCNALTASAGSITQLLVFRAFAGMYSLLIIFIIVSVMGLTDFLCRDCRVFTTEQCGSPDCGSVWGG